MTRHACKNVLPQFAAVRARSGGLRSACAGSAARARGKPGATQGRVEQKRGGKDTQNCLGNSRSCLEPCTVELCSPSPSQILLPSHVDRAGACARERQRAPSGSMGDDIQLKLMFVNYDSPNPTGRARRRPHRPGCETVGYIGAPFTIPFSAPSHKIFGRPFAR